MVSLFRGTILLSLQIYSVAPLVLFDQSNADSSSLCIWSVSDEMGRDRRVSVRLWCSMLPSPSKYTVPCSTEAVH